MGAVMVICGTGMGAVVGTTSFAMTDSATVEAGNSAPSASAPELWMPAAAEAEMVPEVPGALYVLSH